MAILQLIQVDTEEYPFAALVIISFFITLFFDSINLRKD